MAVTSLRHVQICALLVLASCAVGPDYQRPLSPISSAYDRQGYSLQTHDVDGVQQVFALNQAISSKWWELFQSPSLNKLIEKALRNSPDIEAAAASLRKAEQLADAAGANLYPAVSGSYSADRKKAAGVNAGGVSTGSIYNLHNAGLKVAYNLDIWGQTRRSVEQAEAEVSVQAHELEAAQQSLVANVVTAAIKVAALNAKIDARNQSIRAAEQKLDIVQKRAAIGSVSDSDLQAEVTSLQKLRAALPPLQQELDVTRYQLAALLGDAPDHAPDESFDFDGLKLPHIIPVSMPVRLLEQRPDILAAEAQLKSASAAIGVAVANRLPGLSLSGSIGSQATKFDRLFTPGSGIWDVGASLSETLFDAGSLLSKQRAAEAEYDRVKAVYRKTVLAALGDVAGGLRAVHNDALSLKSSIAVLDAQKKRAQNIEKQHAVGAANPYEAADAFEAVEEARINVIDARANRYADTAALFHALGGGWWAQEQKGE